MDPDSKKRKAGGGGGGGNKAQKSSHTDADGDREKRDRSTGLLADVLEDGDTVTRSLARQLAQGIEEALFSAYHLGEQYNARIKTINFNLKKNLELRQQVVSRTISGSDLATMESGKMASAHLLKQRAERAEEDFKDKWNNAEVQALKNASFVVMKKTDRGLEVDTEAEEAKKGIEREEEEEVVVVAPVVDTPKGEIVSAPVIDREKESNTTFEWKPMSDDDDAKQSDDENVVDLPSLDDDKAVEIAPFEDEDEDLKPKEPVNAHIVWTGTVMNKQARLGQLFSMEVDAHILDGPTLRDNLPGEMDVQGHVEIHRVTQYLKAKASDEKKVRSVYKIEACETHEQAYNEQCDYLIEIGKCAVLFDIRNFGMMYAVPPGDLARTLAPDAPEGTLIGVAITDKKVSQAKKENIMADVSSDMGTLGDSGQEKLVKLHETTIGKFKIDASHLRASVLNGQKEWLSKIPKDLYCKSRVDLDEVVKYLVTQKTLVMELAPDSDADTDPYMQILEKLTEKNRALMVLDTSTQLMYVLPPTPSVGMLLSPPNPDGPSDLIAVFMEVEPGAQVEPETEYPTSKAAAQGVYSGGDPRLGGVAGGGGGDPRLAGGAGRGGAEGGFAQMGAGARAAEGLVGDPRRSQPILGGIGASAGIVDPRYNRPPEITTNGVGMRHGSQPANNNNNDSSNNDSPSRVGNSPHGPGSWGGGVQQNGGVSSRPGVEWARPAPDTLATNGAGTASSGLSQAGGGGNWQGRHGPVGGGRGAANPYGDAWGGPHSAPLPSNPGVGRGAYSAPMVVGGGRGGGGGGIGVGGGGIYGAPPHQRMPNSGGGYGAPPSHANPGVARGGVQGMGGGYSHGAPQGYPVQGTGRDGYGMERGGPRGVPPQGGGGGRGWETQPHSRGGYQGGGYR